MDGIKQQLSLQPAQNENAAFLCNGSTVEQSLPASLDEAVRLAAESPFVRSLLPEAIVSAYADAKTVYDDSYFGVW